MNKLKVPALVAVAACVLVCAPAAFASGSQDYNDPVGDANGAPDVGKVTVANDDNGTISIRISVDALAKPSPTTFFLFFDVDRNRVTGAPDQGGAEYGFIADQSDNTYGFVHWNGTAWEDVDTKTAAVGSDSAGVTFRINRSELGNPSGFDFWLRSRSGDAAENKVDDAPDDGMWSYTVNVAASAPQIARLIYPLSSALPQAGHAFTFKITNVILADGRAGAPTQVTCKATLAGRPLRGTGPGGCSWQLPKSARGKAFVVTATIAYQGASMTRRWSLKVK